MIPDPPEMPVCLPMPRACTPTAAAVVVGLTVAAGGPGPHAAQPLGPLRILNVRAVPAVSVPRFERIEILFDLFGVSATELQWPYDPAPPRGVPPGVGISAHAIFTDPNGRQFLQPAFVAQQFIDGVKDGRDWHLPTGTWVWRVRFSPNQVGRWTYRIVATDRGGTAESAEDSFTVTASAHKGFLKVSAADARYFEFDDGSMFHGTGIEVPEYLDDPTTKGAVQYERLASHGINFVRLWLSSMFGSAWTPWIGGRNQYRGYLPVSGLVPFHDTRAGETRLALRLDYEPQGDTGWFDACRMQFWNDPESVQPGSTYRLRIRYRGIGIVGPRVPGTTRYGLVAKMGGYHADCHEPGSGNVVTGYGQNNDDWGYIEGTWDAGAEWFLPTIQIGLENVVQGEAYVQAVSLQQVFGDGTFGPEIMLRPTMDYERYVPEERAFALDKVVENASRTGVYLKLVLMDVNDKIYFKMADNGDWTTGADNTDGFYGLGRTMNRTRWLQQVWWRYAQARWGYSPYIHSWELTNEGDPWLARHYELTDELGKFMHCRVFGVEPGEGDGARCTLDHPNDHLVTTSFWSGFPSTQFWSSGRYPNVDYADLHAYVSTSYAPLAERERMQWDAAYYHTWHGADVAAARLGKPVVRGEGGLDAPDRQEPGVLNLERDTTGVWLHNFVWASLDAGGLYEIYWWREHVLERLAELSTPYAAVSRFLDGIPLNKGGFVDWGGTVSNPAVRVFGQKHPGAGTMHLWVQNREHTWKNVVDGVRFAPQSGRVSVPGFRPGAAYTVEEWDTYAPGGRVAATTQIVADASGTLVIVLGPLSTDVAYRVWPEGAPRDARAPSAPTGVHVVRR
jgi:hypothetical protein